MLRTRNLSYLFAKRSLQPRLAFTQATPYPGFADLTSIGTTVIVPGMVAAKTTGEMFKLATLVGDIPFGLFGNYVNGNLDDLNGGSEISVWRGGPDAEFEIYADALDATIVWTTYDAASAGSQLLYHNVAGKLSNANLGATQHAIARLVTAPSVNKIIVTLENSTQLLTATG
jgi:hypothetical protein